MPPARKRGAAASAEGAAKRRASATSPRAQAAVASAQRYPRGENEPSALAELKRYSTVVADTGDFGEIERYSPQDATTNPSLLLKVATKPQYVHLLDKALAAARQALQQHENQPVSAPSAASVSGIAAAAKPEEDALVEETVDRLFVLFGAEFLKRVPGVVSTEVPAALSFDVEGSVEKARKLISLYEKEGVDRKRVLIKLASTWEGCEAAKRLEKENIHCNMTLLFSFCQAVAAAQAQATLISPFVGRILDWHKQQDKLNGVADADYEGDKDPGVQRVKRVYRYYKLHAFKTTVMAASFRNIGEIISLAGCDKVTVSPALLAELEACSGSIVRRCLGGATDTCASGSTKEAGAAATGDVNKSTGMPASVEAPTPNTENNASPTANKVTEKPVADGAAARLGSNTDDGDDISAGIDEKSFRWALNEDAMATEKLAEGIRVFNRDLVALKRLVAEKIAESNKMQKTENAPVPHAENVEAANTQTSTEATEASAGTQNVSAEVPGASL